MPSVFEFYRSEPEEGITKVANRLLLLELPAPYPDSVAVASLDVDPYWSEEIGKLLRRKQVFSRAELRKLLGEAVLVAGNLFVGAPGLVARPDGFLDVPDTVRQCALSIDALDGRFLSVRGMDQELVRAARALVKDPSEIEEIDLEQVRLIY